MEREQEYVLRTVEERGVRLIRLWFTDVLGQLKSVAITPAELDTAFDEGVQFDGTAINGFSRVHESDVLARPDATTFELLPWAKEDEPSARMFCDIQNLDETPFAGDPRQVLRRNLDEARTQGYSFFAAPEVEFFYFASGDPSLGKPVPLDRASYFDLTTADVSSDLRKRTIHMLEAMGISIEYSFHEDSPSQHEIDLRYTEALDVADNLMTMRLVVKKIALERDCYATFMPKPLNGVQGSGMHTHLSLFKDGDNAFHDADNPYGWSDTARHFTAGVLRHAREITAVTNQLVNSYKRIAETSEAPPFVAWARNNRSALVRVPVRKKGKSESARIEYRAPDPACNPYLAFSLLLAAGMRGVTERYELPEETNTNLFDLTEHERRDLGVEPLPRSLDEALDVMEQSDLVRKTLGDHIFEWFLRNKRTEWAEYQSQVTPFELERYLPST
ncbi:MAG: glutamine synthetase family protein [Acidimicrobiales bacterium]|jgi:glutamine synthetase|nr:glutamine synthetase family protein [Acidimicrobiales bacterium]